MSPSNAIWKAFALACMRSYNRSTEDVDGYATVLTLGSALLSLIGRQKENELSCRFFWKGLPQTPVTKQ